MLGTIVMLELSLDQQQEAGLFLRAQRRPAPPWFILLLLLLLQMVKYSEIDGVDSIMSLAEFVNVIDYSPRLAPGTHGILRPACCGAVSSVSKSKCECFLSLVSHTAQQGGGAPGMSPGHSSWGPPKGLPYSSGPHYNIINYKYREVLLQWFTLGWLQTVDCIGPWSFGLDGHPIPACVVRHLRAQFPKDPDEEHVGYHEANSDQEDNNLS